MPAILPSGHVIRKIWPLDEAKFAAHLRRLDPDTRHARFGMAVGDAFLEAYAATAHKLGTVVFGAFSGATMRAAAELRPLPFAGEAAAEAALTVERPYQGRGLGTVLMERVVTAAQNRWFRQLHMICLKDNGRMQHLAAKFGGQLRIEPDSVSGTITPAFPTPLSLFEEQYRDAQGLVTAIINWNR